jgi:hypothetical protein
MWKSYLSVYEKMSARKPSRQIILKFNIQDFHLKSRGFTLYKYWFIKED